VGRAAKFRNKKRSVLSGKKEKKGKKEEHEFMRKEEKNEERVSCTRDWRVRGRGTRLFISEKGCKDCSRATTLPRPTCCSWQTCAAVLPP